jgi:signal transduction histidine kinase
LRFDDSLETVLSADMSTPFGAQSAWRQLVDLVGRGRVPANVEAIETLKTLRPDVPPPVRAASARALAFANPPAAVVRLFFDDELSISAPVLRTARLQPKEWTDLLPGMSPTARSVLRHRRDLAPEVLRALESFGPLDFRLTQNDDAGTAPAAAQPEALPAASVVPPTAQPWKKEERAAAPVVKPQASAPSPFVSVGSITRNLPFVAEALRRAETPTGSSAEPSAEAGGGTFPIAELVARIDAYQRQRGHTPNVPLLRSDDADQPALFDLEPIVAATFRFETDATGVVRWVEGAARAALIGLTLDFAAMPGRAGVDGVAGGAFRRRARFADARLVVGGVSDAAGEWRISGIPAFDHDSGRFTGYRGTARRPRIDESAAPLQTRASLPADSLRQLVHELRTPTNAIAGFAEMIETQLLGPVPQVYREQASTIRAQVAGLLEAIDDIDMAARIETHALDLRTGSVPLAALLARIVDDLRPLAILRGTNVVVDCGPDGLAIAGDDRAVERLIGRVVATLVSSGSAGETLRISARSIDAQIALSFDRPRALAAYDDQALLTIDAEEVAQADGAPLLGTGFALRLARNLALELGGTLAIDEHSLMLRLPAVAAAAEQASSN